MYFQRFVLGATTALASLPALAFADEFTGQSQVSAVTLYTSGADITRVATFSLPSGQHEVVLTDIPVQALGGEPMVPEVSIDGATLGAVTSRVTKIPPEEALTTELARAAWGRVEAAEEALQRLKDERALILARAEAAEDTLSFLNRVSVDGGADDLEGTAEWISNQSLSAREIVIATRAELRAIDDRIEEAERDLTQARDELSRIASVDAPRLEVTVSLNVAQEGEVSIELGYDTPQASWQPRYRAEVDTVEEAFSLTQSARIVQSTGEVWEGVALTLATDRPDRRAEPLLVTPYIRRIEDPNVRPLPMERAEQAFSDAVVLEAAPMADEELKAARGSYGLNQTYSYPEPVTLLSGAQEGTEITLSETAPEAEIFVRAVPIYERAGYLIASFTNAAEDTFIPGEVDLFRDGARVGQAWLDVLAPGDERDMPFGPVDGFEVERIIADNMEGDRGLIRRSDEQETEVELRVTNRTGRSWPVELIDRVSVSEQEDLKVDWDADPMPDETDLDDMRGVLAWRFTLADGESQSVMLSETLRWPEDKVLR